MSKYIVRVTEYVLKEIRGRSWVVRLILMLRRSNMSKLNYIMECNHTQALETDLHGSKVFPLLGLK